MVNLGQNTYNMNLNQSIMIKENSFHKMFNSKTLYTSSI